MQRATPPSTFVALALLAVTACGSSGGTGSSPDAVRPRDGGSLTYAESQEPGCWDPHSSSEDSTAFVQRPVFDSLVHQTPDGALEPWLASSWRTGKGGRAYTFTLRRDVIFHDGSRMDAAAVKANFDHITAKTTRSQYAAGLLGPYEGTTVEGTYRVTVRFSRPFEPFLQAASTTYLGIASPASLKAGQAALCAGTGSVGSGPFKAGRYVRGQQRAYARNPRYAWPPQSANHSGPARLNSLTIRFLTDDTTRVGALTSDQVDAVAAIPPHQVGILTRNAQLKTVSKAIPGAVNAFYLNTRSSPFSDPRVRKAFQRAIDFSTLAKAIFQGANSRAWSLLSPSTPNGYAPAEAGRRPYDPRLAARLLDAAGWTGRDAEGYRTKDGDRLTVVAPVYGTASLFTQAVQGALKRAGIHLDVVESADAAEVSTRLSQGRYDVVQTSWARGDGDVLSQFLLSTADPAYGGRNFSALSDPLLDRWLKAAQTARSAKQRTLYYAKIQERVLDEAVAVPAYIPTGSVAHSTRVHGLRLSISAWPEFYEVWVEDR
ncbi:ABC transporter substrate-binding protein [Streptomyces iconiensis]|uniref:ABC transporter substrate-binding protein n=1 Tax=Streptomyces iconiensis TaxID=1384038 RepID=A0ABT7A816_9ACTN|nr:ABC transporter substrate-binding protein [Streptomyces iconiensis]MDJ1137477.1 ABC transporter substrate-binding protein [Streptomyces iconiensis]